jgi:hypothetical protein
MADEEKFDVVASAREAQDLFSKAASENARKLCFLGYGLIALFAGLNKNEFTWPIDLPSQLVWSGLLLALALACDLLQYVWASAAFGIYARLQELKVPRARDDVFPRWINWPTNVFFWGKLVLVSVAWVILLVHLAKNVA